MAGTFGSLEIARRALGAQQIGIDVTGHNIANANTKGYSRQRVELVTTQPVVGGTYPPLSIVTGVVAKAIERLRDGFVSEQVRKEINNFGYWEEQNKVLSQLELVFAKPSENGSAEPLQGSGRMGEAGRKT